MIRRRRVSRLSDLYAMLPWSKGPTAADRKTAKAEAERAVIQSVRSDVWARSERCEICRRTELDAYRAWVVKKAVKISHEMHEAYPRALTRGRPPEERFDRRWCMRLCPDCHAKVTAHQITVFFSDLKRGADASTRAVYGEVDLPPDGMYSAEEVWAAAVSERLE